MLKSIESPLFSQISNIIHGTIYEENLDENSRLPVNFSYSVGENPTIIDTNYQNLSNLINIPTKNIKRVKQTHSTNVHIVDNEDMPNYTFEADSLVTNLKHMPQHNNCGLSSYFSLCQR